MPAPLPLFENPVFLRMWRGGCHASWRRWARSPIAGTGLTCAVVLVLILAVLLGPGRAARGHVGIAFALLGLTGFVCTLAMVHAQSRAIATEWQRSRVVDLLTSRLTSRELAQGFFWGKMAGWTLWLAFALGLSGLLAVGGTLAAPPTDLGIDFWIVPLTWASLAFYCVTQSLWAGAVTFLFATTQRSIWKVQLLALLILLVVTPIASGLLRLAALMAVGFLVTEPRGESARIIYRILTGGPMFAGTLVGGGLLGAAAQTAKLLIALLLLRQTGERFTGRMQTLQEQSDIAGE